MSREDPNRNLVDKKFLDDYIDAYERGFPLQVRSNGLWLDLGQVELDDIYVSYVVDLFDQYDKEWCLITPIGKFFRGSIRIKFDEVDNLNEI